MHLSLSLSPSLSFSLSLFTSNTHTHKHTHTPAAEKGAKELEEELARTKKAADEAKKKAEEEAKKREEAEARAKEKAAADAKVGILANMSQICVCVQQEYIVFHVFTWNGNHRLWNHLEFLASVPVKRKLTCLVFPTKEGSGLFASSKRQKHTAGDQTF